MKPGLYISILLLVCCSFTRLTHAQNAPFYKPIQDDPILITQLTEATEKRHQQALASLDGRNKKYLEAIYKERYLKIRKMYAGNEIIAGSRATGYLQKLVEEIVRGNPELKNLDARIVFSRAWWPNANSMGEGTIVFNIGLFNRLDNESQAAFVLCHELAHLYLNHGNKSIERYVNTVYSDEFQKELKRIQKTAQDRNRYIQALAKDLTFRSRRHSREHETEADSLALEWMKNTAFDVRESITCLALLDSVDRDKYNIDPALGQIFQANDKSAEAQWATNKNGRFNAPAANKGHIRNTISTVADTEDPPELDSLKTHPDCSNRIKRIAGRAEQYYKSGCRSFVVSEAIFKQLQEDFGYEIIEHCFRTNNISRSLYYSLQLLANRRTDAYLVTNIGRCFNAIYTARKADTLAKIVDNPSPLNDNKYNKLLHFIHELRLPDIAATSYSYLLIYQSDFAAHEEFLAALITSKANYNKPEERKYWIEQYNKEFPDGKYRF